MHIAVSSLLIALNGEAEYVVDGPSVRYVALPGGSRIGPVEFDPTHGYIDYLDTETLVLTIGENDAIDRGEYVAVGNMVERMPTEPMAARFLAMIAREYDTATRARCSCGQPLTFDPAGPRCVNGDGPTWSDVPVSTLSIIGDGLFVKFHDED